MSQQSTGPVPSLSGHWGDVAARLGASPHVTMFFDFDGTLVPFARRPQMVRLSSAMRAVLGRLSRRQRVSVFVLSGRRQADLRCQINIPGVRCLGLYGWEDSRPVRLTPSVHSALAAAKRRLQPYETRYPGLWLEDKRVSLSVHLRELTPPLRREARHHVRRLYPRLRPAVRLIDNLLDAEFVPGWVTGKGEAVRRLLSTPHLAATLPVYFGNDLSDESAFDAVREGIAIRVGSHEPSLAHYAVHERADLTTALRTLEAALP